MAMRFQDWQIDPELNQIRRRDEMVHLEPLTMNVLVALLENVDEVVSHATLLERFWSGRHAEPGMVARCIRQIRSALADDARSPRYVQTIRKRGYRAIGRTVTSADGDRVEAAAGSAAAVGIAVIPLDDLSPGDDHGWLAQGISEGLVEFLSRIPGLHVPARSSALILKQQSADVETIAARLAVTSVVDGTVQRVGDRITVTVRWTRVSDQRRLWSARFERQLEDVVAVQKEIAMGIAEAIRLELGVRDAAPFLAEYRYQTSDVRAWELFHRGFDLVFTFLPERIAEGRLLLTEALHQDPDYLAARVLLAWSDFERPEDRVDVALEVLARDPANVIAYRILVGDSMTRFDYATAAQLWERAVRGRPGDNSLALTGYHLFSGLGDLTKTLEVTRLGVHLDPLWNTHHYFLGLAQLNLGQARPAIESIRRGIELFPVTGMQGIPLSQFYAALSMACHLAGRDEEAREALVAGYPRHERTLRSGWRKGRWSGMNRALAVALRREPGPAWSQNVREFIVAQHFARAEGREELYAHLEQMMARTATNTSRDRTAYRDACFLTEAINADADFQPYRDEPRFRTLKRALDNRLSDRAGSTRVGF